jgi:hypothetical protein
VSIQAIVLMTGLLSAAPAAESKLLVQDLTAQGVDGPQAAALSTATCHQLSLRKGIDVLCGDDLRALMQWNAMAASFNACNDQTCFESSAKALEARLVVSGSVAKIGDQYVLNLSLFDVHLARSVGRSEVKAASIEALYKQVAEAVDVVLQSRKKA